MNIGILGGTFNPPHLAHLRCAEEAVSTCALDMVLFIPAYIPPHKPLADDISFETRCEMTRIAIAQYPNFQLSKIEAERGGKSYSIDTILHLKTIYPNDQLYFIIGGDSFLELGLWHRYAELLSITNIIVMERPGCEIWSPLSSLPVAIRGEFRYSPDMRLLLNKSGTSIHFIQGTPLQISSTEIRSLCKAGKPVSKLLPPHLEDYLKNQRIYS